MSRPWEPKINYKSLVAVLCNLLRKSLIHMPRGLPAQAFRFCLRLSPITARFIHRRLMNKRILSTVEDLDAILLELDSAAEASDDELRKGFKTFSMEYPSDLDKDPYSSEYKAAQAALYERLSGKTYGPKNEVSAFDVDKAVLQPFPYLTKSPSTVGNHIVAVGNVIRHIHLPPPSTILEFGPGWGNTTLMLARMGYEVTAVDIEKRFIELINKRAAQKNLEIECIHGDFNFISDTSRKWDTILFFECFHHCFEHQELVSWLDGAVNEGGQVIFAAEPITDAFPVPWGFRLDGESLWAIRKFGWCELGFQESYFKKLLLKEGWSVTRTDVADTPLGTVFTAKRSTN